MRRGGRGRLFVSVLLVLAGLLSACSSGSPSKAPEPGRTGQDELAAVQELNVGYTTANIAGMDPARAGTYEDLILVRNIYRGLIRQKQGAEPGTFEGDLAETWSVSPDGKVYTFNLRKGVKWQKGFGDFTADDVLFSFERTMNPANALGCGAPLRDEVESITAPDTHTVMITLKQPTGYFPWRLNEGIRCGAIVSRKAVEKYGDDFAFNPIGTGPFQLDQYVPREKVVLVRNPEYFGPAPTLEKVVLHFMPEVQVQVLALLSGQIQMIGAAPWNEAVLQRLKSAGMRVQANDSGGWIYLLMNSTKGPLANPKVRQAMVHALDRNLVADFFAGYATPLHTPVPDGWFGHVTEGVKTYEYNMEKAKELMAEAGYPNGFTFTAFNNPIEAYKLMEVLQQQWGKLGIKMELDTRDVPAWGQAIRGPDAMMTMAYSGNYPDAEFALALLSSASKPPLSLNFTGFAYDDLITAGRREVDPAKRKQIYVDLQNRIMEDIGYVPIVNLKVVEAIAPNVKGMDVEQQWAWGRVFDDVKILKAK